MRGEQTKTIKAAMLYLRPVTPRHYKVTWEDLAGFGQFGLEAEGLIACALISSPTVELELRFMPYGFTPEERCSDAAAECSGRYLSSDGWRLIGRPGVADFWINSFADPDPSETIRRRLLQAETRQKTMQLPQIIPRTGYQVTSDERMMMARQMAVSPEPIHLLPNGRGKGYRIYGQDPKPVSAQLNREVASFFGIEAVWVESVTCD